jgi:hypothetical protein
VSFVDNGDGTATLAGTPAAGTSGAYPLTITATNGVGSPATQSFTLNVDQAPAITSANATTLTVGTAGSFSVTTTGFPAPAVSKGGSLPGGVTFTDNGDGTATLAGTPAAGTAGTYFLTIHASNGVGSAASQAFTLTVAPSSSGPTFTGKFTCTATGRVSFSPPITNTSNSTINFSLNDKKCHGLNGTPNKQGNVQLKLGSTNFSLPTGGAPGTYNCPALYAQLINPPAVTFTNTWSGKKSAAIVSSGVSLPTGSTQADAKNNLDLTYTGGTVSSGSFSNGGAGAASVEFVVKNAAIKHLLANCKTTGTSSFNIGAPAAGNLVLGS